MPKFDVRSLNTANFRQRVLSALIMAPVILLAVYCGGWFYDLFATLITALGLYEWLRMVSPQAQRPVVVFAFASLLLTMLLGAWISVAFGAMVGTILVLILFFMAASKGDEHYERAGWIALGIPYMAGSGLALLYLRSTPGSGMEQVYYLLGAVWGTDIGAYISGKLIGGPKMAPAISPNKTWAGLLGGMALAALCGYAVGAGFGTQYTLQLIGLSVLLSAIAQLGDLFESYFKRRSGLKESGGLIPGHGGILDRIDGLVFAAIFLMLFQMAVGDHMVWGN